MADKELRRMNRAELIEIIYAQQQNERQLREENEELHRQLDDKLLRLEKAGSIAEAALSLNHIFEDAEAAAQQYLENCQMYNAEASRTMADAKQKAEDMVREAEKEVELAKKECCAMHEKIEKEKKSLAAYATRILENYPELKRQILDDAEKVDI